MFAPDSILLNTFYRYFVLTKKKVSKYQSYQLYLEYSFVSQNVPMQDAFHRSHIHIKAKLQLISNFHLPTYTRVNSFTYLHTKSANLIIIILI